MMGIGQKIVIGEGWNCKGSKGLVVYLIYGKDLCTTIRSGGSDFGHKHRCPFLAS